MSDSVQIATRSSAVAVPGFGEAEMRRLGEVAVDEVKDRVLSGLGPNDGPAKPLSLAYRKQKQKMGLPPIRNLSLSTEMLNDFQVRAARPGEVYAQPSTRLGRIKAWANQQREAWMVFSPANADAVIEEAGRILGDKLLKR